jgi:hypothetical protein
LHAERRVAFPEQAQHRCRARDGGRFARFHCPRELAVRSRAALPLLGHWRVAIPKCPFKIAVAYMKCKFDICNGDVLWQIAAIDHAADLEQLRETGC